MDAKRYVSPTINVTPLIDVLLVLLIIFMVISPLRPFSFKALVPQPPDRERDVTPNPLAIVITIEKDLRLKLNRHTHVGSVDDPGAMSAELIDTFRKRRDAGTIRPDMIDRADVPPDERVPKTVVIEAARSIAYGEVAKVIDAVKVAGARPIGLQIDDLTQ